EYIALLAVVGGVSAALSYATQIGTPGAVVVRATSMAMLLLLGPAPWHQSRQYADAGTLYRATLEANPACWLCETNQAVPLIAGGTPDALAQALRHFQASIAL